MIYGKGTIHTLHNKTYTLPLKSRIVKLYQTDELRINLEIRECQFQNLSLSCLHKDLIMNIPNDQYYYCNIDAEKFYQINHLSNQSINLLGYPLTDCLITAVQFETNTLGKVVVYILKSVDPDIQTGILLQIQNAYSTNSKGALINKHGAVTLTNILT